MDVVIADVEMPRMDGFGLLQAVKADPRLAAIPVILMTSRADPADIRRGLDLGASAYITKQNFDQRELLATIGQVSMKASPHTPARVMIVEDSLVVRQLLAHIITRDPRLILAAAVSSAEEALREIGRVQPDVISMDIRLPGHGRAGGHPPDHVGASDADRRDRRQHRGFGLKISMNALRAGALSVVEKPVGVTSAGYESIAETICTQLYIMSRVPVVRQRSFAWRAGAAGAATLRGTNAGRIAAHPPDASRPRPADRRRSPRCSGALPADFPIPILLVQHMGAPFMEGFASWLDGIMPLDVAVAREQEIPVPGRVYVAPGDRHLAPVAGWHAAHQRRRAAGEPEAVRHR